MVILAADKILDPWTDVLDVDSLLVPVLTGRGSLSGVDIEFLSS